jgi:hypothetical protein
MPASQTAAAQGTPKRRGRPPKELDEAEQEVKRGRGRPPKESERTEHEVKKGRGRPPKNTETSPTKTKTVIREGAVKKGRGRPPKNQESASPAKIKSTVTKSTSKKGRGRPPKNDTIASPSKPDIANQTAPKGRGRPPKKPAQATPQSESPIPQGSAQKQRGGLLKSKGHLNSIKKLVGAAARGISSKITPGASANATPRAATPELNNEDVMMEEGHQPDPSGMDIHDGTLDEDEATNMFVGVGEQDTLQEMTAEGAGHGGHGRISTGISTDDSLENYSFS